MGSITQVIMIFSPKEKKNKEEEETIVWNEILSNNFQFLNNITCISTHTYFQKIQITLHQTALIMRWKIKKQISETFKTKKSLPFSVKKRLKKVNKSIKGK